LPLQDEYLLPFPVFSMVHGLGETAVFIVVAIPQLPWIHCCHCAIVRTPLLSWSHCFSDRKQWTSMLSWIGAHARSNKINVFAWT
jgi:hypothetical protein